MVLAAAPLMILPILAYNLWAATLAGGLASGLAAHTLARPLVAMRVAGGGLWPVSLGDLVLAFGLIVFFVELTRRRAGRTAAVVNHVLTLILFVVCLAEMLLAPACANSVFFLLTLMVLLDVLAGLILTLAPTAENV